MLILDIAKKTLVPPAIGAFLAATVMPSYSAISDGTPLIPRDSTAGIQVVPQPTLTADEPLLLLAFGNSATSAIVRPLQNGAAECRGVDAAYEASCAAAAFKRAARAASRPDYRDARRELNNAAKKLERLVSRNADRSAPKKKGRYGNYKAVKKAAIAKVRREAIKIIQETQTKLLRSSGSGTRKVHYQRIAQAVGSTKVIFRS